MGFRFSTLCFIPLLFGCGPALLSYYVPEQTSDAREHGLCNYPTIIAKNTLSENVEVDLQFGPSSGIGFDTLYIRINGDHEVRLIKDEVWVRSEGLASPL